MVKCTVCSWYFFIKLFSSECCIFRCGLNWWICMQLLRRATLFVQKAWRSSVKILVWNQRTSVDITVLCIIMSAMFLAYILSSFYLFTSVLFVEKIHWHRYSLNDDDSAVNLLICSLILHLWQMTYLLLFGVSSVDVLCSFCFLLYC